MSGRSLRFINTLILILFCILGLTGLYGLVWPFPSSLFEIHRMAGWALIALIPWKGAISLRSLSRGLSRRFDHNVMILISILLTLATVTILVLILLWTWRMPILGLDGIGELPWAWHRYLSCMSGSVGLDLKKLISPGVVNFSN